MFIIINISIHSILANANVTTSINVITIFFIKYYIQMHIHRRRDHIMNKSKSYVNNDNNGNTLIR